MLIFRYQIMLNCWQEDPDNRPTFENLRRELKQMENQHKVNIEKKKKQENNGRLANKRIIFLRVRSFGSRMNGIVFHSF